MGGREPHGGVQKHQDEVCARLDRGGVRKCPLHGRIPPERRKPRGTIVGVGACLHAWVVVSEARSARHPGPLVERFDIEPFSYFSAK